MKKSISDITKDVEDIEKVENQKVDDTDEETTDEEKNEGTDAIKLIYLVGGIIVIFIAIFVGSYFYNQYIHKEKLPEVTYNGFTFVYSAGLWNSEWQRDNVLYNIHFHYNPYEVEDVPVYGQLDDRFNSGETYITFDPDDDDLNNVKLAVGELDLSLIKVFNIPLIAACSKNVTEACYTRPIITCENTNQSVIYLTQGNETRVDLKGNCMTLQGKGIELTRAVDRVLYQWYGIIK